MSYLFNIFLDTTLTYGDPLFKNNYNRNLLKIAELEEVTLFMSKVVFDETRNKYEESVFSRIQNLENALGDLNNFYPSELSTSTISKTVDDFMNSFDEFYNALIDEEIIQIVELNNSFLPILVERSIKRVKPFGPKKQEFRDAITWLSYALLAEEQSLENCIFITGNVTDFCEEKGKLHSDLLKDSNRFKHYVSSKELFEKENDLEPLIRTAELVEWVDSQNVDYEYIKELFEQQTSFNKLYITIERLLSEKDINRFIDDAHEEGYAELSSIEIQEITDFELEIIKDEVLISGYLSLEASIEVYFYNIYKESRFDEDYIHVGSDEISLEVKFSLSYNSNKEINNLEIEDIIVNQKGHLGFYDGEY